MSILTACLLAVCTVGTAQASSTSVTAAIKAQDKIFKTSPAYKSLKDFKLSTTAEAKKLVKEFKALRVAADHAATVVSEASASGAKQKQGQNDWVDGLREAATGMGMLNTALQDALDGKAAAAKTLLAKGQKGLDAGNALGDKGDRLLGLPTSD